MSLIMIDTTVVMPPPPMPAKARAAISSFMLRARPQARQPIPNMVYAKRRHDFRPKISDSLPYSGWKDVRVKKYLFEFPSALMIQPIRSPGCSYAVAIHEVLFNAPRSDPIRP